MKTNRVPFPHKDKSLKEKVSSVLKNPFMDIVFLVIILDIKPWIVNNMQEKKTRWVAATQEYTKCPREGMLATREILIGILPSIAIIFLHS